jgi:arsenate reductase
MAEGILRSIDEDLEIYSAGTKPELRVNQNAIDVMKEIGLDISGNSSKSVDKFLNESFDYVITVCDNAKQTCPVFIGDVKHQLHLGFVDPAKVKGSKEEVLAVYRKVRDEIKEEFRKFYISIEKSFL